MIRNLNGYKIIKGIRGKKGISEKAFAEVIVRLSGLLQVAPEISNWTLIHYWAVRIL